MISTSRTPAQSRPDKARTTSPELAAPCCRLSKETSDGTCIFRLQGDFIRHSNAVEVGGSEVGSLTREVKALPLSSLRRVVIDLSGVTRFDEDGLAALLSARKLCTLPIFVIASDPVAGRLKMSGLFRPGVFTQVDSIDAALGSAA